MEKMKSCSIGGLCGAGFLGLFCPLCFPVIASFLAALGLGFIVNPKILILLMILFSIFFLIGLVYGFRTHRKVFPLIMGLLGLMGMMVGAYVLFIPSITYVAFVLAVMAALWNIVLAKQKEAAHFTPWIALTVIVFLVLIGYLGYQFGFLEFIYKVMMPGDFSRFKSLAFLSVLFGTAAFFSPCALTVLPAYVSHYLGRKGDAEQYRLSELIGLGILGALGIIVVNMFLGLLIGALGAATPFAKDPRQDIWPILAVRGVAGMLIALIGYFTFKGRAIPIPLVHRILEPASLRKSIFAYGIIYNAAAIGCTGPILLGLMLFAFQTGSLEASLRAFLIFSITMGLWMILMTVLAGLFKKTLMQRVATSIPALRRVTGAVMIVVGFGVTLLTLDQNRIFVKLFFPFIQ